MARSFVTSINLNKNEIQNARAHVLAAAPSTPATGQFYFDSVLLKLFYWNGAWIAADGTSILGPAPATTLAIGTAAAAGTATTASRSDHVHPMAAAAAPAASAVGDTVVTGVATTFAASDHKHAREAFATNTIILGTAAAAGVATTLIRSDATILAFDATVPTTSAVAQAAATGSATVAARRDHVHGREAFAAPTAETVFGSSSGAGSATTLPRSDHTHGNPTHLNADHSAINISALAAPTADVAWGTNKITGLKDPTAAQDAATKNYVDGVATGLDPKASVRLASTANVTVATGTLLTIDGVVTVGGDRVLLKNQTAAAENGIYIAGAGAWTRATDADTSAEVNAGMFVFVEEGTLYADTGWVLATNNPITLGTTALTFTQFSGAGAYTAGTGMGQTGTTFNVGAGATPGTGGPGGGLVANADDMVIDTAVVVRKYAVSVGDGVALAYVVTHNLNTQDVVVAVRDNSSPFAFVEPDIEATSVNTVTVRFTVAPTTNQYRVIIHA
jgi:hypothetical protein